MKIVKLLVSTVTLLLLLGVAAPALASQASTSYTFGILSAGIPNTGKTWTTADNVQHAIAHQSINYDFGHPWGASLAYEMIATPTWHINVNPDSKDFLTGGGTSRFETTYTSGVLDLNLQIEFNGFGTTFTYQGPTFTVTLPVYGTVTITHNQVFNGPCILWSGQTEGNGKFATGNVRVSETVTAFTPLAGPLAGLDIGWGTGVATTTR
jgi:hypothetical protein